MSHWLLPLWVLVSGSFQVLQFPLPSPEARGFVARVEPTGSAEVFVLDGYTLTVYSDADPGSASQIILRPETTAVDVADINGDGRSEVLSVAGEKIVRYSLPAPNTAGGTELFQLRTQYSAMRTTPQLQVLVVQQEATSLLALPVEDAIELRSAAGNLVERVPLEQAHAAYAGYGQPFGVRVQRPAQLAPPGGMEMRVTHLSTLLPGPNAGLRAAVPDPNLRRRGTTRHLVEAANLPPEAWPWFPLRTGQVAQERVLYAAADARLRELLVRIRREQISAATGALGYEAGPPRRYPGVLVTQDLEQPDFNGDGYSDLFLWSAAEPSITVNALTRAAVSGKWPLLLMVHLYAPEKNRFEPRAAAHLRLEAPINWYLAAPSEAPLRHVVLADFNGDTRIDFGCSTLPDEYSVWLFSEAGFRTTHDFTYRFPEPLQRIEFMADLSNRNRVSIGLRGERYLYLVRPGPDIPSYPPPIQPPAATGAAVAP
jgi:hypothetical protein